MVLVEVVKLVVGIYWGFDWNLDVEVHGAVISYFPTLVILVSDSSNPLRECEEDYTRCEESNTEQKALKGS